jgi:hypothetical protein
MLNILNNNLDIEVNQGQTAIVNLPELNQSAVNSIPLEIPEDALMDDNDL